MKLDAMDPKDVGNSKAFLKDIAVSTDKDKTITSGLYRLEKGDSMTYLYTYHEMKLIVGGSFDLEDSTG